MLDGSGSRRGDSSFGGAVELWQAAPTTKRALHVQQRRVLPHVLMLTSDEEAPSRRQAEKCTWATRRVMFRREEAYRVAFHFELGATHAP